MNSYLKMLRYIQTNGEPRPDRTGTGTTSVFGYQFRHDLRNGFPLLTTKRLHLPSILHELFWFLSGDTNNNTLLEKGVTIWNEWAREDGSLGPVYGKQWRNWVGARDYSPTWGPDHSAPLVHVDQITRLVHNLKTKPEDRRHIVTAWQPAETQDMALPPCHILFQCYVHRPTTPGERPGLSLQLYQRSADSFLGVPFNIASYAFLLTMLAWVCDYEPRELIISFGDLHIYDNHQMQVAEQLQRIPRKLPHVRVGRETPTSRRNIDLIRYEDIEVLGYDPHPSIKAPVAK